MRLFRKRQSRTTLPSNPVEYPSGIAVRTEKGAYFIHKDGKRYRIQSVNIMNSWNFSLVVDTTEAALANYPVAVSKLGFRDGTLLNNIKDAKLYLVSESKIRHITSPAVFERLGKTPSDCMLVSDADINIMKVGEEIN